MGMRIQNIDKAEELPKRDKIFLRGWDYWDRHSEKDYPWKKVRRFLISREGVFWDSVASEFLKLDWVPVKYRIYSRLLKHVEIHTFLKNKEIYCYDTSPFLGKSEFKISEHPFREVFFVHPVDRTLCYYQAHKYNWKEIVKEKQLKYCRVLGDFHQLVKINNIWYEVKGDVLVWDKIRGINVLPKSPMINENGQMAPHIFFKSKKQLNSKELKMHGLTNSH